MASLLPTVNYVPAEALRLFHRLRGEVVHVPMWPAPITYFFGPRANEFVFAHDHLFRWREAFEGLIPVDGETALIVSDGQDHLRRKALVRPSLHRRQVRTYLEIMARSADQALEEVSGRFDAYALFRVAIRRSTMRSLFGNRVAEHEQEVAEHLEPLFALTDRIQTIPLRRRLGTPLWRRAMAARERLDAFVYAEINRARVGRVDDNPALAMLVNGTDGSGSGLTDLEVRDQIVSLIAAGYETTSGAMGWRLYGLGARPELMAQAREEVLSVCGSAPPTDDQLAQLTLTGAIVTEALRLYPPPTISVRWVAEEFEYAGRRVPAESYLVFSPYVTHRSEDVYQQADEFRPERWLENDRRPPAEYLPFGGGTHRCIGSTMATTELTVMLARLLARGTYRVLPQRVRATSLAAMRPRNGLWIELRV